MTRRAKHREFKERCPESGKVIFPTQAKANAALRQAPSLAQYGGPKRAYKCLHCPGWHLTKRRHLDKHPPRDRP